LISAFPAQLAQCQTAFCLVFQTQISSPPTWCGSTFDRTPLLFGGTPPHLVLGTQLRTWGSRRRPRSAGLYTCPGIRGPGTAQSGLGPFPGYLSGGERLSRWSSGKPSLGRLVVWDSHHPLPGFFPSMMVTLPSLPTEPSPAGLPGGGAADCAWPGFGLVLGSKVPPAKGHSPGPQ
uniref:Uncharacterized protein n=1 Tax=Felis catus TaxID=9685 RepID=A0ABI7XHZ6_FELCA